MDGFFCGKVYKDRISALTGVSRPE